MGHLGTPWQGAFRLNAVPRTIRSPPPNSFAWDFAFLPRPCAGEMQSRQTITREPENGDWLRRRWVLQWLCTVPTVPVPLFHYTKPTSHFSRDFSGGSLSISTPQVTIVSGRSLAWKRAPWNAYHGITVKPRQKKRRARSSVGYSKRLIIAWSQVRVLPGLLDWGGL